MSNIAQTGQQIVNSEGIAAQNTLTAAATGQASSATNANANPANAAPPQPDGYIENQYTQKLGEALDSVATGQTADDILKFKTGGRENAPLKIKKAILREYWTNNQVVGVFFLGLSLGMLAIITWVASDSRFALLVKKAKTGNPEGDAAAQKRDTGEGNEFISTVEPVFNLFAKRGLYTKLAMFLIGFGLAWAVGAQVPHGIKKCKGTYKKPGAGVMPGFAGAQCLSDSDCTTSNRPVYGACTRRDPGAFGKALRGLGGLSLFLGWLVIFVEDPEPPQSVDYAFGLLLGFSGGYLVNYYFAH